MIHMLLQTAKIQFLNFETTKSVDECLLKVCNITVVEYIILV